MANVEGIGPGGLYDPEPQLPDTYEQGRPVRLAQLGAITAPTEGFSLPEISPTDLARIASILRSGSLLGVGVAAAQRLTTPPPQPTALRVADDIVMVFNNQRQTHDFLFRGADGNWRYAQNDGQLVRATGSPDGLLVVDLQALSRAYGGPLPTQIVNLTTIGAEALQGATVLESRARPAGVPANLQTTSNAARTALGLQTGNRMQAHHLIPANVWGAFAPYFATAQTVGWHPDVGNTIALPSDAATQAQLATIGLNLPIHSGSHPTYDAQVTAKLTAAFVGLPANPTPVQIRTVIDAVAASMATEIQAGLWHPRVH